MEKAKTELFPKDSVLELNTKNLDNSPSFLTITHTTLATNRFKSYRILMINVAAEFYFWTEQQHSSKTDLQFPNCPTQSPIMSSSSIILLKPHRISIDRKGPIASGFQPLVFY
jgi:hypothetical protein